jgi:hypothetical protein
MKTGFWAQSTAISPFSTALSFIGSAIDEFPQFLANFEKGQFLAVHLDEIASRGIPA